MNKFKFSLFLVLFLVMPNFVSAEVIKSFDSQIIVNTDSSISVTETIVYDSEGLEKHGIFRDITPKSATGEKMKIQNISVSDEKGNAYEWEKSGNINLKIGDPNSTFSGLKTYIIKYKATNAIGYFDEYDEIYWNITGNDWPFAIEQSSAEVILPTGATVLQQSCYLGSYGSTESCDENSKDGKFKTSETLESGEGVTIAVGFPKNFTHVVPLTTEEKIIEFIKKFWTILIPIFVFIIMYTRWNRKGRDPKATGVIVPQYDAQDLTPLEVDAILSQKVKTKNFGAEIVYLATIGYIKIIQKEEKVLGIFKSKDYTLELLKSTNDVKNEFDRKLLNAIFDTGAVAGEITELSDLQDKFYKDIPDITKSVRETLLKKGIYTNLPEVGAAFVGIFVFIFLIIFIGPITAISTNPAIAIVSIISAIVIYIVFVRLMPAKSVDGVQKMEYLLGLKEYIKVAEKDRINFHNAPEKKPEIFEKLLPFAMVFGLEEKWAKEFDGIYTTPPSWYSSTTAFSASAFGHDMRNFGSMTSSTMTSSPSSSGSGGGGFSGGGGGGGGGGSW